MKKTIEVGSEVIMHFSLKLEDGTELESTWGRGEPARFKVGDGNIPPEIEALLLGMQESQRREFDLSPEEAFGEPDPAQIRQLSLQQFPKDMDIEVGAVIAFGQPDGEEVPGTIIAISDDIVTVDFNSVLSGQPVSFVVEILAIDPEE